MLGLELKSRLGFSIRVEFRVMVWSLLWGLELKLRIGFRIRIGVMVAVSVGLRITVEIRV